MKNILSILLALLISVTSCGTTRSTAQRPIYQTDDVIYVLSNYYPQLYEYYVEGVLTVNSIRQIILEDNTVDYQIKYDFVRYYYRNYLEKIDAARVYFPSIYDLYINGVVEIESVYKYVDRNTGAIRHGINYRRVYGYVRHYPYVNGNYRIYYPPRRTPLPPRTGKTPPPPRQRPNMHNPHHDTKPHNDARPGNGRPGNPPANRPNTNPGGSVNHSGNSRPNNPPAARPSNPRPQGNSGGSHSGSRPRSGGSSAGHGGRR